MGMLAMRLPGVEKSPIIEGRLARVGMSQIDIPFLCILSGRRVIRIVSLLVDFNLQVFGSKGHPIIFIFRNN